MAELREIQLAELDCLKEIDRICKANHIPYLMVGGTMLGAVRHKGFIPWDDDIDLSMKLSDFRKFEKCFDSKDYFLQTEKTDPESPFIMYKVRKNGTRMVEKGMEELNIHQGIWVDIFVYMGKPKSKAKSKHQLFLRRVLNSIRVRTLNKKKKQENALQKVLNHLPLKVCQKLDAFVLHRMETIAGKKYKEYFVLANEDGKRTHVAIDIFDESVDYEFEGYFFPGSKDFDRYLTLNYDSEYMTPKKVDGQHILDYEDVIV